MDAIILTGGKSSRMGKDKKDLLYFEESFLTRIKLALDGMDRILLSTKNNEGEGRIKDKYPNCGPLAGIHSGILHTNKEAVFIVSCDLPLLSREFVEYLCVEYKKREVDVLLPMTDRVHPLCGVYSKNILDQVEQLLDKKEFKVQNLLSVVKTEYLKINRLDFKKILEANINTKEEYEKLLGGFYERD